ERQAQAEDDPGPQEDAPQALGGTSSHPVTPREDGVDRRALEFDVVLRLVSALARTPPGRRLVLAYTPAGDEPTVRARLEETAEAWSFRISHGRLPLSGIEEVAPLLAALEATGGTAAPADFRPALAAPRGIESVRRP